MEQSPKPYFDNFFKSACLFEASLILVAVCLGWLTGINPGASLFFSESALSYGLFGTLPLIGLFLILQNLPMQSLKTIRQLLMDTLVSRLYLLHWTDLWVLSAIAGVAEELLFRGVLQPWFEGLWGMQAGLWITSVVFGLVHAITPMYAVLALLVSVYLGLSLDFGGARQLLIPIVIHGVYDFVVFLLIIRQFKKQRVVS